MPFFLNPSVLVQPRPPSSTVEHVFTHRINCLTSFSSQWLTLFSHMLFLFPEKSYHLHRGKMRMMMMMSCSQVFILDTTRAKIATVMKDAFSFKYSIWNWWLLLVLRFHKRGSLFTMSWETIVYYSFIKALWDQVSVLRSGEKCTKAKIWSRSLIECMCIMLMSEAILRILYIWD